MRELDTKNEGEKYNLVRQETTPALETGNGDARQFTQGEKHGV